MKKALWDGIKKQTVIHQLNSILEWYCYTHKCSNHICMNCAHNDRVDRCEESCYDCPFEVETTKPLCSVKRLCDEAYKDKPDAKKNDLAKLIFDTPAFKEALYSHGYDDIAEMHDHAKALVKEATTKAFFKVYYYPVAVRLVEMAKYFSYISDYDSQCED